MSNVAKSILATIKIIEVTGNVIPSGDRVSILPVKPMIVARTVLHEILSRRNIPAISIVNIGIVKLISVTVAIGTNFIP